MTPYAIVDFSVSPKIKKKKSIKKIWQTSDFDYIEAIAMYEY
jgi:hypothetical protein